MILIDTDVLIDIGRYALDPAETYSTSVLSRAELELGVRRAPTAQERQRRQTLLAQLDARFDWLDFDLAATIGYGLVAGQTVLTGIRLRNKDALIAGQAYSRGMSVMTRNIADYAPFSAFVTIVAPTPKT